MDFRRLQLFAVLADELHFGRAARRAGITQSALSTQIKRLEDELGTALFSRTTREVHLTQIGMAFRKEAEAILARLQYAKDTVRHLVGGGSRVLRIGITPVVGMTDAIDAIARFRQLHPELEIFLKELGTVDQEAALGSGDLDIGLLHPPLDRRDLTSFPLWSHPFDAVFRADRFDLPANSSFQELLAEPIVWYRRSRAPRLYDAFISAAMSHGRSPNIVAEAESFLAALSMTAAGLGVGLIPRPLSAVGPAKLRRREVPDLSLSLHTACTVPRHHRSDLAIAAFLDVLEGANPASAAPSS